jgi:hypothetical protein
MSTNSLSVSTARVIGASPSSSPLSPNDPDVTTALTQVRKTPNSADISLGTVEANAAIWDAGDDDFLEVIALLRRAVDDVESGTERSIRYRHGETRSAVDGFRFKGDFYVDVDPHRRLGAGRLTDHDSDRWAQLGI